MIGMGAVIPSPRSNSPRYPTAVVEKGVVRLQCAFQCCVWHVDTAFFTKFGCRVRKDVFGTRHSQYGVKEPN